MKNNFTTVVIHPTAYDGALEVAAMQLGAWVVGTSTIDSQYKSARDVVKNHLLQEQLVKLLLVVPLLHMFVFYLGLSQSHSITKCGNQVH